MADSAVAPAASIPDAPPPETIYKRPLNFVAMMKELWASRELVRTLTERNLKSRYKQTVLGFGWALVNPLALMVVFTVFLQRVTHIATSGIPYAIFSYVGLLPWTFFSGALSSSGSVLIANNSLLNKVYCPREVFPVSTITASAVDTGCAAIALIVLFFVKGYAPRAQSYWVPLITLILVMFTLGACLLVSALTVYARDLRAGLSIVTQLGLFATPVAYSFYEMIPPHLRPYYAAINPLGPVIQSYRDTVLLGQNPHWFLLGIAAVASSIWVVVGFVVFKKMEIGFADVA
jgi:ABC-2 type transport system permease protein/lipopolysaccharide transport system permease protein